MERHEVAPLAMAQQQAQITARLLDLLAQTADVEKLLVEVARLAVDTVPGCDLASVTVIRDGGPATVASSDERAQQVDQAQYAADDGPCLQAARSDEPVQHDDITGTAMPGRRPENGHGGPPWQHTARQAGIKATLSLPIASDPDVLAALNLYSLTGTGWPSETIEIGEYLADYAGSAVTVAYRIKD
jgi:hypothetical protein